jgi:hypothetical protein
MAGRTIEVRLTDLDAFQDAVRSAYVKGWRDGYGEGRDDEADNLPLRDGPDLPVDEPSTP